jgi:putative AdoMet-dependent methyltransferase
MLLDDTFPSSEFDDWAESYDVSVSIDRFPFLGYEKLLDKAVSLADVKPGLTVLDLGTGTGNLAVRFAALGCKLWCTDFSAAMLEKARQKLPIAHFVLHDLRGEWPSVLNLPFDRIVSAYVFHHFEMNQKICILCNLVHHLATGGRIIIGDISFPDAAAKETAKIDAGEKWEDEFYWMANETIPAMENLGFRVDYTQVSSCAGVYILFSPKEH